MEPEPIAVSENPTPSADEAPSPALTDADRERLAEMARSLRERGMSERFIASALLSTAQTLEDLHRQADAADEPLNREGVQQFIEQNGAVWPPVVTPPRREWKQLERERLISHTLALLRDA